MVEYLMKIELLSDLCVSDGSVYNSTVDVDICYDDMGFPFIPAKRLRGCLRECAIELKDWGMDIDPDKMFGDKGAESNRSGIRIGNALLVHIDEMKKIVEENPWTPIFHQQNILEHFSYIRTQTSMDYETGVAENQTLHTMRVAKKGLIFVSKVIFSEKGEKYFSSFEQCCKIFSGMGVSRTRGMGEISVTLEKSEEDTYTNIQNENPEFSEDLSVLEYKINLQEPVICKIVNGETADYIEGNKILGLLIENATDKENFFKLMSQNEFFCSNAYISKNGQRFTEVPAFVYSIKNNKTEYINKLYPDPEEVAEQQLNSMKHAYVNIDENQNLERMSVDIEERYHHRRPEDKGIGRAVSVEFGDSDFYSMASIKNGQEFCGFIVGNEEFIRQAFEILKNRNEFYIGYGRSSEYGKIQMEITKVYPLKKEKKEWKHFYVKLEAPTIVYNDRAFYSTDKKDLISEILYELGLNQINEEPKVKAFVNYVRIAGFNTTWQCNKPVITGFDKGSVVEFNFDEPVSLDVSSKMWIGERVGEGYGEISLHEIPMNETGKVFSIHQEKYDRDEIVFNVKNNTFAHEICEDLLREFIKYKASEKAKTDKISDSARPTVSNMLLMCKENTEFNKVVESCKKRYEKDVTQKKEKYKYAMQFIESVTNVAGEVICKFKELYKVEGLNLDENKVKMLYMESYLQQLKYGFRKMKGGNQ